MFDLTAYPFTKYFTADRKRDSPMGPNFCDMEEQAYKIRWSLIPKREEGVLSRLGMAAWSTHGSFMRNMLYV